MNIGNSKKTNMYLQNNWGFVSSGNYCCNSW